MVPLQSDSFTLCEVEFLKTSKPFRRVRLCELVFGFLQYFNRDNIKSCSVLYETSLTMERLPSSQIQMTIDNSHRQYNLLKPHRNLPLPAAGTGPKHTARHCSGRWRSRNDKHGPVLLSRRIRRGWWTHGMYQRPQTALQCLVSLYAL